MSDYLEGFYINLDSDRVRRESLEQHLLGLGIDECYCRFPAISPSQHQSLRGLGSLGELGIWNSTLYLLLKISTEDGPPVVNVLEDDFRFGKYSPHYIEHIAGEMHSGSCKDIDIIFLDYFINDELMKLQLDSYNGLVPPDKYSAPLRIDGKSYLACLSSYLIKRSFAHSLLSLLLFIYTQNSKLPPIDLAIRQLIGHGRIRANLVMPPLGCPDWTQDNESTVQIASMQEDELAGLRQSQRIFLLLRIACSGMESPSWCCKQLRGILGLHPSLGAEDSLESLLTLFLEVKPMLEIF